MAYNRIPAQSLQGTVELVNSTLTVATSGVTAANFIYKFLRGTDNSLSMNTNGATSVKTFSYQPSENIIVGRLNVEIVDGGVDPATFGGLSSLTTGIKVNITTAATGAVELDFLDGETIKSNSGWGYLVGVDNKITTGVGDDTLNVRWTPSRAGQPLLLRSTSSLNVVVQDDLTGLTEFEVMVQGVLD